VLKVNDRKTTSRYTKDWPISFDQMETAMADPNNAALIDQIHKSEREIDALENRIANLDDSIAYSADHAAMRTVQEEHRQRILKCKSDIDQNKWSEARQD